MIFCESGGLTMKSKYWALILIVGLVVCVALSVWLFRPREAAKWAEIWSDGELVDTVYLLGDDVLTVQSAYGTNVITVFGGKIAVTEADCPDHYCMHRGFCNSGAQIVCLPNRLVIKFVGGDIDGVAG